MKSKRSVAALNTGLRVFEAVSRYMYYLAAVLLVSGTILLLVHVVMRYVFGSPLKWGEELAMTMTTAVVMLGVPYFFSRGTFVRINVIADLLPRRVRDIMEIITSGTVVITLLWLTYYSARLTARVYGIGVDFPYMGFPEWPLYMTYPLGLSTLAIAVFIYFLRAVRRWRAPRSGEA
jgi:TRAP-type C4-dicarboxylate transport system permease small subunit